MKRMKRNLFREVLLLVVIFLLSISVGCSNVQTSSELNPNEIDLNQPQLKINSEVTMENEEEFKANIFIEPQIDYHFVPIGVYIRPFIRSVQGKTETQQDAPFMVEATHDGEKGQYHFSGTFPKVLLTTVPNIDNKIFNIEVRGYFLDDEGRAISQISAGGTLHLD